MDFGYNEPVNRKFNYVFYKLISIFSGNSKGIEFIFPELYKSVYCGGIQLPTPLKVPPTLSNAPPPKQKKNIISSLLFESFSTIYIFP